MSDSVPVYAPATCAAVGETVAPTKTYSFVAPPTVAFAAVPDGVKAVQPVVELVPFQQPVQVPSAKVFAFVHTREDVCEIEVPGAGDGDRSEHIRGRRDRGGLSGERCGRSSEYQCGGKSAETH